MIQRNNIYNIECLEGMRQMEPQTVDLILTDLPYGTTHNRWDSLIPLEDLWEQYRRILKQSGVVILTSAQPFTTDLINSNRDWFRFEYVWKKNRVTDFLNAHWRPLREHESVLVFSQNNKPLYHPQHLKPFQKMKSRTETPSYNSYNGRSYQESTNYPRSILTFDCEFGLHPTQKPVALFEHLIRTHSNPGDLILDNCLGSGTTAIACINAGRDFVGFETDDDYFTQASGRIEKHTNMSTLFDPQTRQVASASLDPWLASSD